MRLTFPWVDSWNSWFNQPRAAIQLPVQTQSPLSLEHNANWRKALVLAGKTISFRSFLHGFHPCQQSSLATEGANVPRSLESYLDQQRVALPTQKALRKPSQLLGILRLNVHYILVFPLYVHIHKHSVTQRFWWIILTWPPQCKQIYPSVKTTSLKP